MNKAVVTAEEMDKDFMDKDFMNKNSDSPEINTISSNKLPLLVSSPVKNVVF